MTDEATDTGDMDLGTLEPIEVKVTIGGKPYLLREASAADAAAFKNAAMGGVKLDKGEMVGLGKAADAELVLVARCLHRPPSDGSLVANGTAVPWTPVGLEFVKTLPARIVTAVYDRCRAISHLDKGQKADAAAGKGGPDSTGTTTT